jgi:endoglucanase
VLQFQSIFKLDYSQVTSYIARGYNFILNIQFDDSSGEGVLKPIIQGQYDKYLTAFAQQTVAGKNQFWIRTLHEQNGNWYPWGILWHSASTGKLVQDINDYKAAWKHIVAIFRSVNSPARFQNDINSLSGEDNPSPLSYFMPDEADYDGASITSYNRAFLTQSMQYSETFYEAFAKAYYEITAVTNKPIALLRHPACPTGLTKCCGSTRPGMLLRCTSLA